jgi:hypothetical protein
MDNMEIKAADLNRGHLGLTIQMRMEDATFRDTLAGVSHEADLVEERRFNQEVPDYMLGRITTTLRLAHGGSVHVSGNQEVELTQR